MTELVVGPFLFKTKKAAKDECKRVLNAYSLGATIQGQDAQFLYGVLERHGSAENKIGCGVDSFQVEPDRYGSRCFWLTRGDGSRTYFSYRWCFDKPPDAAHRARLAFRCEIQEQVIRFKLDCFKGVDHVLCASTGAPLEWHQANVDHTPPLHSLRDRFLRILDSRLEDIEVQKWREGEHRYLFENRGLAGNWQRFHVEHAELQILSEEANAKKGGRE